MTDKARVEVTELPDYPHLIVFRIPDIMPSYDRMYAELAARFPQRSPHTVCVLFLDKNADIAVVGMEQALRRLAVTAESAHQVVADGPTKISLEQVRELQAHYVFVPRVVPALDLVAPEDGALTVI